MHLVDKLKNVILDQSYGNNLHRLEPIIVSKITVAVNQNKSICFVMPAFPGKSPNDNSCFSFLPGKEEEYAMSTINIFQENIRKIYSHGCKFNIVPDGHYFHSLGITRSYKELDEYINELKHRYPSNVDFYSITDIFQTKSIKRAVSLFEKQFISNDYQINNDYLKNEVLFIRNEFSNILFRYPISKTQIQKKCKDIAKKSFLIKNGISKMIEHYFPENIRLSIHYQPPDSSKMGLKLIPQAVNRGTPWFGVLYISKHNEVIIGKRAWNIKKTLIEDRENSSYFAIDSIDIINSADIKVRNDIALGR